MCRLRVGILSVTLYLCREFSHVSGFVGGGVVAGAARVFVPVGTMAGAGGLARAFTSRIDAERRLRQLLPHPLHVQGQFADYVTGTAGHQLRAFVIFN